MTTIKAGTTSTTGFVVDTDASGTLVLQSGGSNDAVVFNSQTQQAAFTHAISQPGSFMFRNKIINGNFDIWQRGTSQTTSSYGSADRWYMQHSGSTKTASRQAFDLGQTEVPNNPKYFMRHVVTSVAGASNYVMPHHRIESVETLSGKTATLSFWAKADASKNIAVEFRQYFGTGGSPDSSVDAIGAQLVALTTSWARYTVTVDLPSVSEKTLGTDGNDWLGIYFWFDAGSDFDDRAASLGQQSGTFDIAQVQLEEGSVATPFEQKPLDTETQLCFRYFYSFIADAIGQRLSAGLANTTTAAIIPFDYLRMRTIPSGSYSNLEIYSAGSIAITSLSAVSGTSIGGNNMYQVYVVFNTATMTAGYSTQIRATAIGGYLFLDAEL